MSRTTRSAPPGRRPVRPFLLGLGSILLGAIFLTACSGGSDDGPGQSQPTPAGSSAAATATALPAGFTPVGGTAYRFGLPSDVRFVLDQQRVTDDGSVVKRWRYAITPKGPFCLAEAAEQANFDGQFPQSVVELFAANTQPDQHTLRNEVMPVNPAGTIGGVNQESTFTGRLDDGSTFASHFYQRKYLTSGHSLIALAVGGPEDQRERCRMAEIIGSFAATGQEFTGATPDPAASASASTSTGS